MNTYYKCKKLAAKYSYHKAMIEILTSEIDNTTDPETKNSLIHSRAHHRKMYRKYWYEYEMCWFTTGKE